MYIKSAGTIYLNTANNAYVGVNGSIGGTGLNISGVGYFNAGLKATTSFEIQGETSNGTSTFKLGTYAFTGLHGAYISTDFNYSTTLNTDIRLGTSVAGDILTLLSDKSATFTGNIRFGRTASASTSSPDYIHTGESYSDATTANKCKIFLHDSQYGFGIGGNADVQYHTAGTHDFYRLDAKQLSIGSGIATFSGDITARMITLTRGYGVNLGDFQLGAENGLDFYIYNGIKANFSLKINPNTQVATFSGIINSTGSAGFAIGGLANVARIQYGTAGTNTFNFVTAGNADANIYAGAATFGGSVTSTDGHIYLKNTSNGIRSDGYSVFLSAIGETYLNSNNSAYVNAAGTIISGVGQGFLNSTYQAGYNRIWAFGNALPFGFGYYQGTTGLNPLGNDAIGFHFGDTNAPKAWIMNSGSIVSANEITAFSDRRLKKVIENTPSVIDNLMKVRIVNYQRTDNGSDKIRTGVIAQELKELFPQYVSGEGEEMQSVNYSEMVSVCIKAIQELKAEINLMKGVNK